MRKSSDRLGFKIVGDLEEVATPWAGASLLLDLFRHLELGVRGGGQGLAAEEVEQGSAAWPDGGEFRAAERFGW